MAHVALMVPPHLHHLADLLDLTRLAVQHQLLCLTLPAVAHTAALVQKVHTAVLMVHARFAELSARPLQAMVLTDHTAQQAATRLVVLLVNSRIEFQCLAFCVSNTGAD